MNGFKKFEEELISKEKLYSSLTIKRISPKQYKHDLNPNLGGPFRGSF